ncbi:MAG: divalent metal cation transporter [Candidatus Marsarchaeota archaeon]
MSRTSSLGPGIIEGLSCVEASMIGTYAYVFGSSGTSMLWVVVIPFLLWPLIEVSASVLGQSTHRDFLEVTKARYGDAAAALTALSLMASNVSAMVAELVAASLALSMLSGFPWPVFLPFSLSVLMLAPTVTGRHWKLVVMAGSIPMLAFPLTAALILFRNPSLLPSVAGGVFVRLPAFKGGDVAAVLGATVAPDALFFAEESGYEERAGMLGVEVGHAVALLISLSVAVTFALSFDGVAPSGLSRIAGALAPTLGRYAYLIFPAALFSSCVAAFVVALRPWLSALSFLAGFSPLRREEFVPATLALVLGASISLGLMTGWSSMAFEEAAYTSGVISSVGLVLPLLLLVALVLDKKGAVGLPRSLELFLPVYALLIVGMVLASLFTVLFRYGLR